MVQCDQCDRWYHGLCVGVSPEDATTMDQFVCPTCMGGISINRVFLFYRDDDDYDEEEAPQAPPPPGAARRRGSRGPSSTCPFLGCLVRTRTMRTHVTVAHLHPVFRRSVPPEAGASLRYRVLMWMSHHLLGEGATPEDLARDVPTGEVFQEPAAGVPSDLNRAMEALCRFVGEDPPHRFALFGRLHPALLLHWRVQAHLVSRLGPDLRRAYRELWSNETVSGHPLSQYGMFRLLPPPPPAPCHEDWDAPDPPVLGSICLEESEDEDATTPPESFRQEESEDEEATTPRESFRREETEVDEAATPPEEEPEDYGPDPTSSEDELVGALEPWDPWVAGRARGVEFSPEFPRPPPGTATGGYMAVDYPRGYAGARRVHILILEEW